MTASEVRQAARASIPQPVTYDGDTTAVDWQDRAACLGLDPELFFEKYPRDEALMTCIGCPVRAECLGFALSFPQVQLVGVWGGTTGLDRRRILRACKRGHWGTRDTPETQTGPGNVAGQSVAG